MNFPDPFFGLKFSVHAGELPVFTVEDVDSLSILIREKRLSAYMKLLN